MLEVNRDTEADVSVCMIRASLEVRENLEGMMALVFPGRSVGELPNFDQSKQ